MFFSIPNSFAILKYLRVSSAAIKSAIFKILMAFGEISATFPMGMPSRISNPLTKSPYRKPVLAIRGYHFKYFTLAKISRLPFSDLALLQTLELILQVPSQLLVVLFQLVMLPSQAFLVIQSHQLSHQQLDLE